MKLALGSAQFGLEYGVTNQSGKTSLVEVEKILQLALDAGVQYLDTAITYGNSEEVLGNFDLGGFKVITKIPKIPSGEKNINSWVEAELLKSLARLNLESIHGVLLHFPNDLLLGDGIGAALAGSLSRIKAQGLVEKIGVSIYSPDELGCIFDMLDIDIVQAPINLLDRRMESSGWLNCLNSCGVEIHARSVFLQGLMLLPRKKIPRKFEVWSQIWDQWSSYLEGGELSAIEACLSYPLSLSEVSGVIVGVESGCQLNQIIHMAKNAPRKDNLFSVDGVDELLITPSLWGGL